MSNPKEVIGAHVSYRWNSEHQAHEHFVMARRANGTMYRVPRTGCNSQPFAQHLLKEFAAKHGLGMAFDGQSASVAALILSSAVSCAKRGL